jgi:hypothetical protein
MNVYAIGRNSPYAPVKKCSGETASSLPKCSLLVAILLIDDVVHAIKQWCQLTRVLSLQTLRFNREVQSRCWICC